MHYFLLSLLSIASLLPGTDVRYKARKTPTGIQYNEGIRDEPIQVPFIKLLGVLVNNTQVNPNHRFASMRFFLPESPASQAYLLIREVDFESYYRLDQVQNEWHQKELNEFTWDAGVLHAVEKEFGGFLNNLTALVRLQSPTPSMSETIAAVYLTSQSGKGAKGTASPTTVKSYSFSFSCNFKSEVYWQIKSKEGQEIASGKTTNTFAGRPFQIHIPAQNLENGSYRLNVTAINRKKLEQSQYTCRFHHVKAI